jgi:hypothetical protein
MEPSAGGGRHAYVSYDFGRGGDVTAFVNLGMTVTEAVDHVKLLPILARETIVPTANF